jgi:hypothetical protein
VPVEEESEVFTLTSTAFEDGQEMAQRYRKNVSPPLTWRGALWAPGEPKICFFRGNAKHT